MIKNDSFRKEAENTFEVSLKEKEEIKVFIGKIFEKIRIENISKLLIEHGIISDHPRTLKSTNLKVLTKLEKNFLRYKKLKKFFEDSLVEKFVPSIKKMLLKIDAKKSFNERVKATEKLFFEIKEWFEISKEADIETTLSELEKILEHDLKKVYEKIKNFEDENISFEGKIDDMEKKFFNGIKKHDLNFLKLSNLKLKMVLPYEEFLSKITTLRLGENKLRFIPKKIFERLKNVKSLYLWDNELSRLPLNIVFLSRNKLKCIPTSWICLPELTKIFCNSNPLLNSKYIITERKENGREVALKRFLKGKILKNLKHLEQNCREVEIDFCRYRAIEKHGRDIKQIKNMEMKIIIKRDLKRVNFSWKKLSDWENMY
jgi:hypothetical protein